MHPPSKRKAQLEVERDIRMLEDFDCEMRIRYLQQKEGRQKAKTYEQLVEEHGDKVPTHCEHGIPLNRKCGVCRALLFERLDASPENFVDCRRRPVAAPCRL